MPVAKNKPVMAVDATSAPASGLAQESGSASSVDVACEVIRESIRSGRFAGGDRIREVEVCALANVSRTSVRQALTLLAAEGKSESVLRGEIEELRSTSKSLMPDGLEKDLVPQDFADLIEFVRSIK